MTSTDTLWSYLKRAKAEGKEGLIYLHVGEKELGGRYASELKAYGSHFELVPMPTEASGLSATQVRTWVRDYARDAQSVYQELSASFSYIKDPEKRHHIIRSLVNEWRRADHLMWRTRGR